MTTSLEEKVMFDSNSFFLGKHYSQAIYSGLNRHYRIIHMTSYVGQDLVIH